MVDWSESLPLECRTSFPILTCLKCKALEVWMDKAGPRAPLLEAAWVPPKEMPWRMAWAAAACHVDAVGVQDAAADVVDVHVAA